MREALGSRSAAEAEDALHRALALDPRESQLTRGNLEHLETLRRKAGERGAGVLQVSPNRLPGSERGPGTLAPPPPTHAEWPLGEVIAPPGLGPDVSGILVADTSTHSLRVMCVILS